MRSKTIKEKLGIVKILLALSLLVNVVILGLFFFVIMPPQTSSTAPNESGALSFEETGSYILYIGTNDKDTNEALLSAEEAQAIVDEISQKYTDGFTSVSALGHWKSPQNIWVSEDTLIYMYYGIDEDEARSIADEIVAELNQYSVLIEYDSKYLSYYPSE